MKKYTSVFLSPPKYFSGTYNIAGNQCNYLNGELHSINDVPAVIINNIINNHLGSSSNVDRFATMFKKCNIYNCYPAKGTFIWCKNGEIHRENNPAIITKDYEYYLINGKLHCEYGPAVKSIGGHFEFWLDGNKMTEKAFCELIGNTNNNYYDLLLANKLRGWP
jgi:hypothetical protein